MELHQDSSPYINDLSDFPDAQHHSSTSPFDQFDFSNLSSTFPHTPSYNGSYHNSPFSAHSELSFSGEADQFGLFDEEPLVTREDYDPSEYDPPNSGGLLMFPNFMENGSGNGAGDQAAHVSVTPAFDYSSPSSNGGADSGPDGQPRSRGSSISSNPNNNSPRLDVTQGFENMRFESPNWGTHVLPGADRSISPPHKPQSPPQLLIPDSSTGSSGNVYGPSPPVINAPDGDGDLMGAGPQLHIVPATPISGGGGTSQPVPFQSSLETLQQGASSGPQQTASSWDQQTQQQSEVVNGGGMQYPDPAQLSFNFPGHGHSHSHDIDPRGLSTSNTQVHPNGSATNPNPTSNNIDGNSAFLFPFPPRSRRKSDTDLHPPHWANMNQDQQFSGNDGFSDGDNSATVNLSDILPSQQQHQSTFMDPTQSPHNFTFGPPSSTNYLSPDMNQLRRSKSDSGSRPGHQRQSRSEDIYSTHGNVLLPYPPSSQQEFISRQFLHPQEGVPPSFRGNGGREHARRASSGSRGIGGIGGVVEGSWSGASSSRPSPYPSPSASPRYRADELPGPGLTTGRQAPVLQHDMHDMNIGAGRGMEVGAVVSKPNVTTGRTANASRIRRKQEANFMCPVPGCGSTFTRSFNLKGHMRSHNEEKPFQCKWPGCGKGFARQHDCKRHEQLHSNYRPFTCDGCNKNFARMDALNRHLRSEGGAECQRVLQEAGKGNAGLGLMQQQLQANGQSPPMTKMEDSGWPGMSVML